MPKSTAVIKPNLGLYLDRPAIAIPPGGLQTGLNFRIQLGQLNNLNLGWTPWNSVQLNGPVTLIEQFNTSEGSSYLIFGTPTDLYYDNAGTITFLTPQYGTGTVAASGTGVTGSGTAWNTTPSGSEWANAKPGDQISFAANVNSPTATWYTIATVNSDTSLTLSTSAGTVAGGTSYTIRRLFTGGNITNPWMIEVFVDANPSGEDLIFFTNGLDNVATWNGTDSTVTLQTTFGFTCKALCQFADVMTYHNVVYGGSTLGTTMLTSDAGAPLAVGNASTGIAGQFIVQGGTDPIVNAVRLGQYLVIYCLHTIIVVQSVGEPLVYVFRIGIQDKGPIAPRGISVFPYNHQFIGPDSMYSFDGNTAQPVNTHVWRSVLSSLDHIRQANIFTFLDEQNGEQIWAVPQTTDPGAGTNSSPVAQAWTEHYLEETAGQTQSALIASAMGLNRPYSTRSFPFTAIGNSVNESVTLWSQLTQAWTNYNYRWSDAFFSASFPFILAGDANGYLYQLNSAQNGNGTAQLSYVTFGRRAVADGKMRALVRRFYPFVDYFTNALSVTFGFADFASGPVTTSATLLYQQTNVVGQFFIPVYRRGRYVDIQVGDTTANPWILNGYDLDIMAGGLR